MGDLKRATPSVACTAPSPSGCGRIAFRDRSEANICESCFTVLSIDEHLIIVKLAKRLLPVEQVAFVARRVALASTLRSPQQAF